MCCRFRGSRITKVTRLQDAELSIVVANEPAALAIHCGDTDDDDGEVIPKCTASLPLYFFCAQCQSYRSIYTRFAVRLYTILILNNHHIIVPLVIALSLLWVLGPGRPSLGWHEQYPR